MIDIWAACRTEAHPAPLAGSLRRVVESQQQVATTGLVDDLAEQALLEELIESSKPALPAGTRGLHYLLSTPFRYPPLAHGSRFAARDQPSLLYGARERGTALAECAYYRFVFWYGMATPPPAPRWLTQHTTFTTRYRCRHGLRLQCPPFSAHRDLLCHRTDYRATQRLGAALRAAAVDGFEFGSARDPEGGINVALFEPAALSSRRPLDPEPLLCETGASLVRFRGATASATDEFPLALFLVDGELPQPAP